ncbi:LruC domain-containing protein [Belliella sp. R4-6]|uniref:LruC domain-containing protein n=1 Tax=Belliella alkalica TaxID=1730871 RepID=A0ABS9V6K9_9BACT|nr:LruC domain-containing protein [Belliella alkalica]MCH7412046.1 LruC domain-containing protein [Belliella alkalica]
MKKYLILLLAVTLLGMTSCLVEENNIGENQLNESTIDFYKMKILPFFDFSSITDVNLSVQFKLMGGIPYEGASFEAYSGKPTITSEGYDFSKSAKHASFHLDKEGNFSSPLKLSKNINTLYLYSNSAGINQVFEVRRNAKNFTLSYEIPSNLKAININPLAARSVPGYNTFSTNAWDNKGLPFGIHNKFIQAGFLNRLNLLFSVSSAPGTNGNNITFGNGFTAEGRGTIVGFDGGPIYEYFPSYGQTVVLQNNFLLPESTSVELTFLDSDRAFNHALGYKYKKPGDLSFTEVITFPNTGKDTQNNPVLLTGHSIKLKDLSNNSTNFPAGTEIGLFVVERSFNPSTGSVDSGQLKISQDEIANIKGNNQNITRRFVALKYPEETANISIDHPISTTNSIIMGFEQHYREDFATDGGFTNQFTDNLGYGDVKVMLTFPSLNVDQFSNLAVKSVGNPLPNMPYYESIRGAEQWNFTYHPAENAYTRVMFEDNWPSLGDADFNDMVVDYNYVVKTGTRSLVGEVAMDFKLIAVSAAHNNSFGVRLVGMPEHHSIGKINKNGTNVGDPSPESIPSSFIVFGNVNTILGNDCLNTPDRTKNGACAEAFDDDYRSRFSVFYDKTALLTDFSFAPFIYVNGNRGREINLMGTVPSALADARYFGRDSDNTGTGTSYSTKADNSLGFGEGLPWVIQTPAKIELPQDRVQINKAYPDLVLWATTGSVPGGGEWYSNKIPEFTNRNKGLRPTP